MGKGKGCIKDDHEGVKHETKRKHKKKEKTNNEMEVHSANAWEEVKFESDDRREKFLRLMGAQKQRKHTGAIQIGEKNVIHTRAGVGVDQIDKKLEEQFTEGLEHKNSWKRHAGLGCSGEGSSNLFEKRSIRLDMEEDAEASEPTKTSKYINFVKSSNSS